MKLFDVYSLFDITPVKAKGCYMWDDQDNCYLDLYGGHAVISIGHAHPHYIARLTEQLNKISFYSNSVKIPMQKQVADLLGKLSGFDSYQLFMCNSGAEANENALKLASFVTGKKKVISFSKCFHGRTSGAVAITDNPSIISPFNENPNAIMLPFNELKAVEQTLEKEDVAAVIIEGIQGVGGIRIPDPEFLEELGNLCHKHKALLILDEVQSGYGRTGKFFAFQHSNVQPDLITTAKGMGNGFPVAGVLIHPDLKPRKGMLGTTFGGNYMACAASLAVLEVMEKEQLIANSQKVGAFLKESLSKIPGIKEVRGEGLMIGIEFDHEVKSVRSQLLHDEKVVTGASGANIIRLLPPLSLNKVQANDFISKFEKVFKLNTQQII